MKKQLPGFNITFRQFSYLLIALLLVCCFPLKVIADGSKVGKLAPQFSVESGDDKKLTLDMARGKVIVLFYESKDMVKQNKELKDSLNEFYHQQTKDLQDLVIRLVVINCTSAYWPTIRMWKNKLYEGSLKKNLTIYGDWDGKMFADYNMQDHDSNFMIIDKKGLIRYYQTGKVQNSKINDIKKFLFQLVNE